MNRANESATFTETDPSLASLVPERSTWRNRALALTALLVLGAGWASPLLLRPTVASEVAGGSWAALEPHHQVVTSVQLDPKGWPRFTVQSVEDVPGATVVGAWVVPGGFGWDSSIDPAAFPTALDYLEVATVRGDLAVATELPQRVAPGESAQLVTLWDIVDCSLLVEDRTPEVEMRSVLRTPSHESLPLITAPGFDSMTLAEAGICPAS